MKRILMVFVIVVFVLVCGGCETVTYLNGTPINRIGANISVGGWHPYSNQISIINQTSFPLTMVVNGKNIGILPAGEYRSLELWAGWGNFSASHEVVILVLARQNQRTLSSERRTWVSTQSQRAESWTIRDGDLR